MKQYLIPPPPKTSKAFIIAWIIVMYVVHAVCLLGVEV